MIISYSVLIVIIGLSFTQGIYHKVQTDKIDLSRELSLDEARFIVHNTNHSNNVVLFGNKISCEACNLEAMIVAGPNKNTTIIIDTKYAYDLELRSGSSNGTLLCQMTSYKFAEHGKYVLNVEQITSAADACPIEQMGNPSNYLAPAICGIVFVVLYTVFAQLWSHIYRSQYSRSFRTNILHQKLADATSQASTGNIQQSAVNETNEDIVSADGSTIKLPLTSSPYPPEKKTRTSSKRLRALDTFRGFSLMVMIFVNYGGMCLIYLALLF
jgi:hypothetical protein